MQAGRTVVATSHGPLRPRSKPMHSRYVLDRAHEEELERAVELAALGGEGSLPAAPHGGASFGSFIGNAASGERRGWRPAAGSRSKATGAYGTPTTAGGFMRIPVTRQQIFMKAPPPALHHSKGHGTAVGAGGLLDHVTLILDQVLLPPGDDADADITIHVVAERFSAVTRHMVVAVPGFIAELHVTVPDGIEEGETFAVRFN